MALPQNHESGAADFVCKLNAEARSSGAAGGAPGRRRWNGWLTSGRARWASQEISAEHLTLGRQGCRPRDRAVSPVIVGRTKSSKRGQPVGRRPACARCEQLQHALDAAQSELQAAQEREAELQARLANLRRSLFGRKSETTPAGGDEPSAQDGVTAECAGRALAAATASSW